jgi:hypothetical protein
MPLRDHFRPPLDDITSWEGFHGRWPAMIVMGIAIFPAAEMLSYEVPGELQDLVLLIKGVYASHRHSGGPLKDAFARSVPDPDRYLHGRPPAEDRPIPPSPTRRAQVRRGSGGKR